MTSRSSFGTQQPRHTLNGHVDAVNGVCFNDNGTLLASASRDQTIKIWNPESGELIRTLHGHDGSVNCVAFNPASGWLASGSDDRSVKLWDPNAGAVVKTLEGHSHNVFGVAFSSDGSKLASTGHDKSIKLWNSQSGTLLLTLTGHIGIVSKVQFSSDASRLVSASRDSTIRLWSVESGSELKKIVLPAKSAVFSFEGTQLAAGCDDHTVRVWNASPESELSVFSGHEGVIESVAISSDGRLAYSTDADEKRKVWDVASGVEVEDAPWHEGNTQHVSSDGRWLVTWMHNKVVLVDRAYKNSPRVKAYREFKAGIKPHWHKQEAKAAEAKRDWYAATFHRAWILKAEPEAADNARALRDVFRKLKTEYNDQDKERDVLLHPVVIEMLELN